MLSVITDIFLNVALNTNKTDHHFIRYKWQNPADSIEQERHNYTYNGLRGGGDWASEDEHSKDLNIFHTFTKIRLGK